MWTKWTCSSYDAQPASLADSGAAAGGCRYQWIFRQEVLPANRGRGGAAVQRRSICPGFVSGLPLLFPGEATQRNPAYLDSRRQLSGGFRFLSDPLSLV